uniref:Large ribosomal subunit protein uL15 n=1 Tax=Candidatus Kentrum sp. SD TaxID=2126332 RepID=A0A450YG73_9GAMM|nr:MAG: LSU ribosomal protein L15P [Candidatus Kentron sp. SD]VFK45847.1 MAG: LSU ribosomal protein L15P [Candidatus Kentron sp. SD]VFK79901.1 MAG: LSU ribosomal protein L15P [Candidatus Kentron sp. SD]
MRLNDLQPSQGSRNFRARVGRGMGSGLGKTCGRGHKGQRSRAGSGAIAGFEGGQMPLQRRLPKYGFSSRKRRFSDEVRLRDVAALSEDRIDLDILQKMKLVNRRVRRVKIILKGNVSKSFEVKGVTLTKGAYAAIEAAGGRIEK